MSLKRWRIQIHKKDDPTEIVFFEWCDDLKECQALATEARSRSMTLQIWIYPPYRERYSWD